MVKVNCGYFLARRNRCSKLLTDLLSKNALTSKPWFNQSAYFMSPDRDICRYDPELHILIMKSWCLAHSPDHFTRSLRHPSIVLSRTKEEEKVEHLPTIAAVFRRACPLGHNLPITKTQSILDAAVERRSPSGRWPAHKRTRDD